ncbi:Short-chain dehydrogenase/reductase SDR [Paraburkholderia piptadeniae]|uniref:Short-chain dehydrogenase/reductase SDR n=1 Tax=Paraburkholderia piptadeniae TaxID=1701573 RepID=A0A1N7S8D0_9BURK|nr:SDR family oxidoreductase [Paraburkholderia piptadeniae]SIT43591.1 Short-chain dehydrogenase/reductase SDR [Paraburkholderia piptadeniae]
MKNILVVGGSSAIAIACARCWLQKDSGDGVGFFITGRNAARLEAVARDLFARGARKVETCVLDVNDHGQHRAMLEACSTALGRIDIALFAHGSLPDQALCERDADAAVREIDTNAVSTIALLTRVADMFDTQRHGMIAVISSVAGDRGRPSNYVYGAAKAAVTTFCEGLRARLFKRGVGLLIVKPGFVDTPMTAGLSLPGALVATPDRVAGDIVRAIESRKDTLYTPWFWSAIMLVIRALPQFVFKRASL